MTSTQYLQCANASEGLVGFWVEESGEAGRSRQAVLSELTRKPGEDREFHSPCLAGNPLLERIIRE